MEVVRTVEVTVLLDTNKRTVRRKLEWVESETLSDFIRRVEEFIRVELSE